MFYYLIKREGTLVAYTMSETNQKEIMESSAHLMKGTLEEVSKEEYERQTKRFNYTD